jgi:hypothetical protein
VFRVPLLRWSRACTYHPIPLLLWSLRFALILSAVKGLLSEVIQRKGVTTEPVGLMRVLCVCEAVRACLCGHNEECVVWCAAGISAHPDPWRGHIHNRVVARAWKLRHAGAEGATCGPALLVTPAKQGIVDDTHHSALVDMAAEALVEGQRQIDLGERQGISDAERTARTLPFVWNVCAIHHQTVTPPATRSEVTVLGRPVSVTSRQHRLVVFTCGRPVVLNATAVECIGTV